MVVEFRNGTRKVGTTDYPKGHALNPMNDEDVNAKFRSHAQGVLSKPRMQAALAALWGIDQAASLDAIFESVRLD